MPTLRHRLVDLHARRVYPAEVVWSGEGGEGRIESIRELGPEDAAESIDPGFLMPGFVDAHVHVESSMLPPREFARVAARHGTVATVSDPHEIANVLGEEGLEFMLAEAREACIPIAFGVPSCVPATDFETAGARLDADAVARLLARPEFPYLSEMMNWPGVLGGDAEVAAKIAAAKRLGKPVDGHAPGLRGEDAVRYASAGISTDHECFTLEEARDKVAAGMKVLIREGSAARNLATLRPLIAEHPESIMFCTDDSHPDELVEGHLDRVMAHCVERGFDRFDVLRAACVHPVEHYGLETGLLREGDRADFILVDDLDSFRVRSTWVAGRRVARDGVSIDPFAAPGSLPNAFRAATFSGEDFRLAAPSGAKSVEVRVIEAIDGELVTNEIRQSLAVADGLVEPDPASDTLMLAVCNRYEEAPPAVAFIRNIGLGRGAIASSVGHDSHQVVAVGADRTSLATAVDAVFEARGGLAVVDGDGATEVLPLPIAGLMSDRPAEEVGKAYERLSAKARELGSTLEAPFMTLSFMALLVIPALKLGDRGLFDARAFRFVDVIVQD
ncbi:MAG: adenine deaminase [Phycisphaerales bacterium]|jgi:adenine deaminase